MAPVCDEPLLLLEKSELHWVESNTLPYPSPKSSMQHCGGGAHHGWSEALANRHEVIAG